VERGLIVRSRRRIGRRSGEGWSIGLRWVFIRMRRSITRMRLRGKCKSFYLLSSPSCSSIHPPLARLFLREPYSLSCLCVFFYLYPHSLFHLSLSRICPLHQFILFCFPFLHCRFLRSFLPPPLRQPQLLLSIPLLALPFVFVSGMID
jgi:hypothetical protein